MVDSPHGDHMTYKILFPIETAARELLFKTVLASKLASSGHECYLGAKSEIYHLFDKISPFVYFDKGYHPNVSDKIYNSIKENGGVIVNLDEEGGVDFKNCNTISKRYPEKIFECCDLIYLWGTSQYNLLKSKRVNFDKEKVVVSGHPRFELLKPEYHHLYAPEVSKIHQKYKDYILISTNMGFGNNIRGDDFVRQNYGKRIKNIDTIIEFDKEKTHQIIDFVKKLSLEAPYSIILRPHPEEDHGIYKNAFKNIKNIHVLFEGSVIPWLIGAVVMIHPDCTTGIESLMVGNQPISLMPDFDNDLCTFMPIELSVRYNDQDKLKDDILNKKYPKKINNGYRESLNGYFSYDMDSTDIIIENLIHFLSSKRPGNKRNLNKGSTIYRTILNTVKRHYYKATKNELYLLQENKLKGFNQKVIYSLISRINNDLLNAEKVKNTKINRYLFKISPQD